MVSEPDPVARFNLQAGEKGWPMHFEYAQAFDNPKLSALLDLWKARSGDGIPGRAQFTAKVLKPYLRNVSIVERELLDDRVTYRFRLIGTELARLFGDRTGEVLEAALPEPFVERWAAGYDTILAAGRPIRVVTQFELPQVNYLEGEGFHAPLRSNSGETSIVLSATFFRPRSASQMSATPA